MGYVNVFDDIVKIMHEDYSGCVDKKGWDNPELYREKLVILDQSKRLTRAYFEEIVQTYLNDFKDDHNVLKSINKEKPAKTIGFRVRRYRDKLYVEKTDEEKRLQIGSIIFSLDNNPIPLIADKYRHHLKSEEPDKEEWSALLLKAFTCEVKHPDGSIEVFYLAHYPEKVKPSHYTFKKVTSDVSMITVNDYRDAEQLEQLIQSHHNDIISSEHLIIDVRECRGGSDSVYLPLLNYIFAPNSTLSYESALHYMTDRNYNNRMASIEKFSPNSNEPLIKTFISEMKKNKNKGFVEFDFNDYYNQVKLVGSEKPRRIILLTDKYCSSSGDQFVIDASQSEKVTIVGRPTKGVIDYSNQVVQFYDENGYEFCYATSKSPRVDRGEGLDGKGIQPYTMVPWTPEHLKRDVDLETVLEMINGQGVSKI